MSRPSDADHARAAARHVFEKYGNSPNIEKRLATLGDQGVHDEATLADHAYRTMTAPDTKCFRGADGRESYANDRLNTIVHTRENNIASNTVYGNDELSASPSGRTATQRLRAMSEAENKQSPDCPCQIQTGGSLALEEDRRAEAQRHASSTPGTEGSRETQLTEQAAGRDASASEEEREEDVLSLPEAPEQTSAEEELEREADPEDDLTR